MRLSYTRPESPARKRAAEYGFVKDGYFFYLIFEAVDGVRYVSQFIVLGGVGWVLVWSASSSFYPVVVATGSYSYPCVSSFALSTI